MAGACSCLPPAAYTEVLFDAVSTGEGGGTEEAKHQAFFHYQDAVKILNTVKAVRANYPSSKPYGVPSLSYWWHQR